MLKSGARKETKDAAGLTALNRLDQDRRRETLPAQYETLRRLLQ